MKENSKDWISILNVSIMFAIISASFPTHVLIKNMQTGYQAHRIWWMESEYSTTETNEISEPIIMVPSVSSVASPIDLSIPWIRHHRQLSTYYNPLTSSAFCRDVSFGGAHYTENKYPMGSFFPTSFSSSPSSSFNPFFQPYQPWIFDAGLSADSSMVNILVTESDMCEFNMTTWQELVKHMRTHGSYKDILSLANGSHESVNINYNFQHPSSSSSSLKFKTSQISVSPSDMKALYISNILSNTQLDPRKLLFTSELFVNKRVVCRFYDSKLQYLVSVLSYRIIPGMIIRCPVPVDIRKLVISQEQGSNEQILLRLQIPHPNAPRKSTTFSSSSSNLRSNNNKNENILNNNNIPKVDNNIVDINVGDHLPRRSLLETSSSSSSSLLIHENNNPFRQSTQSVSNALDDVPVSFTQLFPVCPGLDIKKTFKTKPKQQNKINKIPQSPNNNNSTTTVSIPVDDKYKLIEDSYAYNTSVCMSTTSQRKDFLLEWIEYHRMIGIDHFFIYDRHIPAYSPLRPTSSTTPKKTNKSSFRSESSLFRNSSSSITGVEIDDDEHNMKSTHPATSTTTHHDINNNNNNYLPSILQEYIDIGLVTLIPWPYRDCVNSMACDHAITSYDSKTRPSTTKNTKTISFKPPPKIQKHTAMMSCYMRFKSSSKWMAFLDDNEFIGIDTNHKVEDQEIHSINDLIQFSSDRYSNLAAIELSPYAYVQCPLELEVQVDNSLRKLAVETNSSTTNVEDEDSKLLPPRFGLTTYSQEKSLAYNMKNLILRTSMVTSFQENYVLVVELDDHSSSNKHKHRDRGGGGSSASRKGQQEMLVEAELKEGRSRWLSNSHMEETVVSSFNSKLSPEKKKQHNYKEDNKKEEEEEIFHAQHDPMIVSHESAVRLPKYDKIEGRRGNKNAKGNEYSIAEFDSSTARVLQFRSFGDNMCDKALFEYRTAKDVCSKFSTRLENHRLKEQHPSGISEEFSLSQTLEFAGQDGQNGKDEIEKESSIFLQMSSSPFMRPNIVENLADRFSKAMESVVPPPRGV